MADDEGGDVLTGTLTKKFGPLPFWAWLGLGVVGLVYYLRKKAAASTSASTAPTGTPTGNAGMYAWNFPQVIQGQTQTPTNSDWASNAVQWVIAHQASGLKITPLQAQNVIAKYLAGGHLNQKEQDIINTIEGGTNAAGTSFGTGIGAPPTLPTPANGGDWNEQGGRNDGNSGGGVKGHKRGGGRQGAGGDHGSDHGSRGGNGGRGGRGDRGR